MEDGVPQSIAGWTGAPEPTEKSFSERVEENADSTFARDGEGCANRKDGPGWPATAV